MGLLHKLGSSIIRTKISLYQKRHNNINYYLLTQKNSDCLIVVFSGFPAGNKASYNYIRTLNHVKCNKLFLLDDFGYPNKPGTYYLGEKGNWFLINDIIDLINIVRNRLGIKHTIMVGSSKGGTSALYYSLMVNNVDNVIIGAPQYYVGNYLSSEKNKPILKAIMGSTNDSDVQKLNNYIKDAIYQSPNRPLVNIHYSPCEHTYNEHIKPMIEELKNNGFNVCEDNNYTYLQHSDVAKFFPSYLLKTIKEKTSI